MRHHTYAHDVSLSAASSRIARSLLVLLLLVVGVALTASAAYGQGSVTVKRRELYRLEQQFQASAAADRQAAIGYAQKHGLPLRRELASGSIIQLMAVRNNLPVYCKTMNLDAADSVGTDELWPGGSTAYGLTGSGIKLGIWDGGPVRVTHQEFGGRATLRDASLYSSDHPSHVAGTMIAAGVAPQAKGMAYEATLDSYDWDYDTAEMASAALEGMQLSNHSYGYIGGWEQFLFYLDGEFIDWIWIGDITVSQTEDYTFGLYDEEARHWDAVAYNAPEYLAVKSAGNERDQGPVPGTTHVVFDNGSLVVSTATRKTDGGPDGYDCLTSNSVAKNILTVAAVEDIVGGYTGPEDVVMSTFSSWGPADDGRIKPDISANGVDLYSAMSSSDSAYMTGSGTSMAAPNTTGTLGLILEKFLQARVARPLSSTLKALVIHTAHEAGPHPGPDYMFGWGLLNAVGAVDVIAGANAGTAIIREESLADGEAFILDVEATGLEPLKVTIVWTDVPGTPVEIPILDPTDRMLVNDLDLRVTQDTTTYEPWLLDVSHPAAAATTGDNDADNVEKIEIDSPVAGTHRIVVSHKGALYEDLSQDFSLIVTGIEVPTHELAVQSTPETGVEIAGTHAGTTDLVADVPEGFPVVLTAPKRSEHLYFTRWKNASEETLTNTRTYTFDMNEDTTVIAEYTYQVAETTVFGWGLNSWGQIGDGTEVRRLVPTATEEVHEVVQLSGGTAHSLAVTPTGEVLSWGGNSDGQLGYDTSVAGEWHEPRDIIELSDIVQVSAGMRHSLAVDSEGNVWAWGRNLSGQLGDGTLVSSSTPVQVVDLADVTDVAAGEYHSIALKNDGTVWAWGSNVWGQLGDDRGGLTMGTYMGNRTPQQVVLPEGVVIEEIAAGANHNLALADDGTIYSWGANAWGQLGNNQTADAWLPVQVVQLTGITAVAAGSFHSLAIDGDGVVWAWGANWWGQLGDSTFANSSYPKQVAVELPNPIPEALQIVAGEDHSAMRTVDGEVYVWGWNHHGQLGTNNTTDSWQPVQAIGLEDVACLASGAWHLLASAPFPYEPVSPPAAMSGLLSTGLNTAGQLGLGDNDDRDVFTRVPDLSTAVMVDAGDLHDVVLMRDGTVWMCGSNEWGQLGMGDNDDRNALTPVTTLPDVTPVAVEAGAYVTFVLDNEGNLWACGRNTNGELGMGDYGDGTERNAFLQVPGIDRVVSLSSGGGHTFALRDDGSLWAVGRNDCGQLGLGDGAAERLPSFTQVENVVNVGSMGTGACFSMVLRNDGTVWTCGLNDEGQLGQGGGGDLSTFTQVTGLSNITQVTGGLAHAFALDADGNVWATGRNASGQLGLDDTAQRDSFEQVIGLANIQTIIASGGNHSLAIDADRQLRTCGDNAYGQLGLADTTPRDVFTLIPGETVYLQAAGGENHSVVLGREPAEWTIMVYLDGDNNLESAAIEDFLEMAETAGGDDVNVVVLFDRSGSWDTSYGDWTSTRRGLVIPGDVPDASWGEELGELNMGNAGTLADFIAWTAETFPSQRSALVLWNHGDGWYDNAYTTLGLSAQALSPTALKDEVAALRADGFAQGVMAPPVPGASQSPVLTAVCFDDASGGDALSLAELGLVLEEASSNGVDMNLIGFDACLMGMVEVAYEIRDHAEVMVASEELVPGAGWAYDEILAELVPNPSMTAAELGVIIVDEYASQYGETSGAVTHAAIDLTMIDTLAGDIDAFAQAMSDDWEDDESAVQDAAQTVLDSLDNAIIHEWHSTDADGSNGLAIYFPSEPFHYNSSYDGITGVLAFTGDLGWDNFVQDFYATMLDTWIGTSRYQAHQYVDLFSWWIGPYLPSYVHMDLRDFCERVATYVAPTEFYSESLEENGFQNVGGALAGWMGLDTYIEYELPFALPFFGEYRTTIWISNHGYIDLSDSQDHIDWINNSVKLLDAERIAPFWTDLNIDQVYVSVSDDDDVVTIRWEGWEYPFAGGDITFNFEVELHSDGVIRFNYGEGNEVDGMYTWGYDEPTIGISRGNGVDYYLSSHHHAASLDEAETQVFTPEAVETGNDVLYTTGANGFGQLGHGDDIGRSTFTQVPDMENVVMIDSGDAHTVALMGDGTVWTCGNNQWGQLGMGDNGHLNVFTEVTTLPGDVTPVAVEAGGWFTLVLDIDGSLWVCGRNTWGELGTGSDISRNSFVQVPGMTNVVSLSAGGHHTLALRGDGTLWSCGRNDFGQLGLGNNLDAHDYRQVTGISSVAEMSAGSYFSMLVLNNGTVMVCGDNADGQLGLGSGSDDEVDEFTVVPGLANIDMVSAGGDHALALDTAGNIWACGANASGQLGLNDTTARESFVQVADFADVESIAAMGSDHSLAIDSNDQLWVCGDNATGQLGLGDATDRLVFTEVSGMDSVGEVCTGAHGFSTITFSGSSGPEPAPAMTGTPSETGGVGDAWVFGEDPMDGMGDGAVEERGIVIPPVSEGESTDDGQSGVDDGSAVVPTVADSDTEAVVDNRDNTTAKQFKRLSGDWPTSTLIDGYYDGDYAYARARSGPENSRARFSCTTLMGGRYDVYAWWSASPDRGANVAYEIRHADGVTTVRVNQTRDGGQWVPLGDYQFAAGAHAVEIHNGLSTPGSFVCADAVRFELVPGTSPYEPEASAQTHTVTAIREKVVVTESAFALPSLTLKTPAAPGLELVPGNTYNVTWESTGLPSYAPIEISLYRGGEFVKRLVGTPNKGRWTWHVGYDQRGDAYSIRIHVMGQSDTLFDESDSGFVIALPGEW